MNKLFSISAVVCIFLFSVSVHSEGSVTDGGSQQTTITTTKDDGPPDSDVTVTDDDCD